MVAPVRDSASSNVFGGGAAALSVAHSLGSGSGSNRLLVAVCCARGSSNAGTKASGLACGGQAPTGQLADIEVDRFGNFVNLQRFYWLDADLPAGSGSVNVTGTGGATSFANTLATMSWDGAEQVAPPNGTPTTVASNVGASSTPITTVAADADVFDALVVWLTGTGFGLTPGGGQSELSDVAISGADRLGTSAENIATPGAQSQTWSWTPDALMYAAGALEVAGAGGAPPAPTVGVETGNLAQGDGAAPFSHTLTNADSRIVLVMTVAETGGMEPTGVTHDGDAMTLVATAVSTVGAGNRTALWAILRGDDGTFPAGVYSIVLAGGDAGTRAFAVELNDAEQAITALTDTDNVGSASSISTSDTPLKTNSMAVGIAGHGEDPTAFNSPPSGSGTWTRLFDDYAFASSAQFVGAFQSLSTLGAVTYTESVFGTWNRASMILTIWPAVAASADNPFFHNSF